MKSVKIIIVSLVWLVLIVIIYLMISSKGIDKDTDVSKTLNSMSEYLEELTYVDVISITTENKIVVKNLEEFYKILKEKIDEAEGLSILRMKNESTSIFALTDNGSTFTLTGNGFADLFEMYQAQSVGFNTAEIYLKAKELNILTYDEYQEHVTEMREFREYSFLKYENYVDAKKKGFLNKNEIDKFYYPLKYPESAQINEFTEYMKHFYPDFIFVKENEDDYKRYCKTSDGEYYRLQLELWKELPEFSFRKNMIPSLSYYYMRLIGLTNLNELNEYLKLISSKNLSDVEKARAIKIEAAYDGEFELPLTDKQMRYSLMEIRVRTADEHPITAILKPTIIFDDIEQYRGIINPFVPAIVDSIRIYLSDKKAEELKVYDKSVMQKDLTYIINKEIGITMVGTVYFTGINIIEF